MSNINNNIFRVLTSNDETMQNIGIQLIDTVPELSSNTVFRFINKNLQCIFDNECYELLGKSQSSSYEYKLRLFGLTLEFKFMVNPTKNVHYNGHFKLFGIAGDNFYTISFGNNNELCDFHEAMPIAMNHFEICISEFYRLFNRNNN